MTDEFAGVDIAGLDNGGLDIDGLDIDGLDIAGLDIDGRLWAIDHNILTQCTINITNCPNSERINHITKRTLIGKEMCS